MSRSELERLVASAEHDPHLRHRLRQCRTRRQLVRTAWRFGFGITRGDLVRAWSLAKEPEAHPGATGIPRRRSVSQASQAPVPLAPVLQATVGTGAVPRLAVACGLALTALTALTAPALTHARGGGLPITPGPVGLHG